MDMKSFRVEVLESVTKRRILLERIAARSAKRAARMVASRVRCGTWHGSTLVGALDGLLVEVVVTEVNGRI